jgi:outer membrane protein TolC
MIPALMAKKTFRNLPFGSLEGLLRIGSVRRRNPKLARLSSVVGVFTAGGLAGCSSTAVGPDHRQPTTPIPSAYRDNSAPLAPSNNSRVASDWWREFGDADLNSCLELALKENPGLKGALARVEQARALTGPARASYRPLFQGGRNRAYPQRSQAVHEEAIAGYRQALLNACREVQDALTTSQRLTAQSDVMTRAVANARGSRELAAERYRLGRTSYLEVIEAQLTALAVERSVAEITGQRWITRVTLIRALGGGWELSGKV